MRTQVAIIGGGPSGLLLSQLLNRAGVATVVLERRSRTHVLSRIRAGVLEQGTVDLLHSAGAGDRLAREGRAHHGCRFASDGGLFRVDFSKACGRHVTLYGQTEVTQDLYAAQDALGATILHEVGDVGLHDLDTLHPRVTFTHAGQLRTLSCDVVAGCDGFHGVSRRAIPPGQRNEVEKVYPFAWLGVLSRTPPVSEELIYARHPRGFALCSLRNPILSRYYIQVPATDRVEDWSDDAFWAELKSRLPDEVSKALVTGPSIEKSVAPLRSFVCSPMQWGSLFLCGDAAHIVPPTGAKGLNLAAGDVFYLSQALLSFYSTGDRSALAGYSDRALARVWTAMSFAWSMTTMLHDAPGQSAFDRRMQQVALDRLRDDPATRRVFAEGYTGAPY
jgi:p-hydroxybenzoate 3-monooxygenase